MNMICLGIESTAHTFGVGIVTGEGKILADTKSMYKPPLGQGIHPRKAFEHHIENSKLIVENALNQAKIKMEHIDVIAFSKGPGLPNSLAVGAFIARFLSLKYKKPIIGVNHPVGHVEIGKLTTGAKDPVVLYCSGGNTQIIAFTEGKYRVFGETLDIPIGNAFDVLARYMKLEMPGGPKIEKLAKKGCWVELPYIIKGMDFSFSGIVTESKKLLDRGASRQDICFSIQESCFSMLVEATERALTHTEKKEVLITGGVAANYRLRKMIDNMCRERGSTAYSVELRYSGDNGVMISWPGILSYQHNNVESVESTIINKDWRIDEAEIPWMNI